jgi:hypothetical protein
MYIPQSKELAGGTCVVSVGLKKKWARTATYWIEIWKVPFKAVTLWYAVRRWFFIRRGESKNEKVEGEIPSTRCTSFTTAQQHFQDLMEKQIADDNKGYVVDTAITSSQEIGTGAAEVEAFIDKLRWTSEESKEEPEVDTSAFDSRLRKNQKTKVQSKKEIFSDAVKKRKKDAQW